MQRALVVVVMVIITITIISFYLCVILLQLSHSIFSTLCKESKTSPVTTFANEIILYCMSTIQIF